MAVIIYNPKLYGGKPCCPKNLLWDNKYWKLGVNKIAKFPDHVAEEMLKRWRHLERVEPEDLEHIKKRMAEKQFRCPHCPAEFEAEKQLQGHLLGKHKIKKETQEFLDSIPDAETSEFEGGKEKKEVTEEDITGISQGDQSFYGKGIEDDTMTDMKKSGGTFK